MDKMFAEGTICKEFNFPENEHRSLPKDHATDIPEGDLISRDFSLTSERIRQIEARALRKLRNPKMSGSLQSFMEA